MWKRFMRWLHCGGGLGTHGFDTDEVLYQPDDEKIKCSYCGKSLKEITRGRNTNA